MEFHYHFNGIEHTIRLEPRADGSFMAYVGGQMVPVEVQHAEGGQLNLRINGKRVHAYTAGTRTAQTHTDLRYVALVDRETCFFEIEKISRRGRQAATGHASSGLLTAQMPAQVMDVFVSEGDTVQEGDPVLLLEAMKMEIRVTAPVAGKVIRLMITVGKTVDRGQALAEITPGEQTD